MSQTTTFTARQGGVMTTEVGAITGELELRTDGSAHEVRYLGADEWYTPELEGEPTHEEAVEQLSTPAPQVDPADAADPPAGSVEGRDAQDPAAGSFGGALQG